MANAVTRYFRESYEEMRKVAWPGVETTRNHTLLVIAISVGMGLYFVALDYLLNKGLEALL